MGLDIVEFVLAVEDAFQVTIPNAEAAALTTPGLVIAYLERQLAQNAGASSVVQRAFYRVRAALIEHHGHARKAVTTATPLVSLWSTKTRKQAWLAMKEQLNVTHWPPAPSDGFFARHGFAQPHTVGELAEYLVAYEPATLLSADERWTRPQIEEVVRQLVEHQFSIPRSGYTLDSRFVQDLHLD